MRHLLLVAPVALAFVLSACGGAGSTSLPSSTTTTGLPVTHRGEAKPARSFPDAPRSQHFALEGRCPIARPSRYLPRRAGCLSVRRADVDGDGRPDLVLLYARLNAQRFPSAFTLKVVRASGGTLSAPVRRPDLLDAKIARLRDVNARPGVEIFIHDGHVTTEEDMGVYTFDGGALRRAGSFAFDGADAGIVFGFTCHRGPPATIVEHNFEERIPFRGVWDRTDTTYRWVGAELQRAGVRKARAKPSRGETGAHC